MDRMMNAHHTAGATAADARMRVQHGLGYGWQMVVSPCAISDFAVATTSNKRQPRRLGQRTT